MRNTGNALVAFCTSPRFADHNTGPHHPERPDRLRAIFSAVRDAGMVESPNPFPASDLHFGIILDDAPKLLEIEPRMATNADLLLAHPQRHIDRVRLRCETGGALDEGDTLVGHGSFEVAMLSVGACLQCVDSVMTGQSQRAFAAVRPPGHHAEPNAAMGFCLFSNVAVAARYAQHHYGLKRVAIVDFDVHHGNGTQAVFSADPSVLFISLHEDPHTLYPNSGYGWEIGTGVGRGYTLNLPMQPGQGNEAYLAAFRGKVIPKLEWFAPELLLVSAGFDAHKDDPLADMQLTEDGFHAMTKMLVELADRQCAGRVVSILEGGYNLRALGRSVVKHLLALAGA